MSNWSLTAAHRFETLGAGTGDGTAITASSTVNVKGSTSTIGTTGFDWSGFVLQIQGSSGARYRLDLYVNTGGSDQLIAEDIFLDTTNNTGSITFSYDLPIAIPAGAVLKARCQATAGSNALRVLLNGYACDTPGFRHASRLIALNGWTNTDPSSSVTQSGTSYTAWTQLTASTPQPLAGLLISMGSAGDTTRTSSRFLVQIGSGGSGSEVARATLLAGQSAAVTTPSPVLLPGAIPAGTRLAFRVQCQAAAADTLAIAAHGLVA